MTLRTVTNNPVEIHPKPDNCCILELSKQKELKMTNTELQVKHTPAPWKAVDREILEDGSVYPSHIVGGDDEKLVCYLEGAATAELAISHPNSFWYVNEAESANTQLIVAAPETAAERDKLKAINSELLEALKELMKPFNGEVQSDDAYQKAKSAIAKAEGKYEK